VNKYSNHTLSLHRLTSNSSSSTANFPWLSHTDNWTELSFCCAPLYAVVLPFSWLFWSPNSNSVIPLATNRFSLYSLGSNLIENRVTCHTAWRGPHRKHLLCCQNACLLARCPALVIARTTQKHFFQYPFHCYVRVFRALLRNGSTCHTRYGVTLLSDDSWIFIGYVSSAGFI
jgi:hypothetical protein